jgi:hypothetical protein
MFKDYECQYTRWKLKVNKLENSGIEHSKTNLADSYHINDLDNRRVFEI